MNKILWLNDLKTRAAISEKISEFDICVEATIYLLLYNLQDCTFNCKRFFPEKTYFQFLVVVNFILTVCCMY